jgi:hypothetical protein
VVFEGKWVPCKFLKSNLCTIYETRLGRDLGGGHRCVLRSEVNVNYPDCLYNREGQALHPAYR